MSKLSVFLNYFISAVAFSALIFGWGYFLTDSVVISLIITAFFFALFSLIYFFIKGKREKKLNLSRAMKQKCERVGIKLLISATSDNALLFSKLLDAENKLINDNMLALSDAKAAALCFNQNELTEYELLKVLKNSRNVSEIDVYCISNTAAAKRIADSQTDIKINFFSLNEIFAKMSERGIYPEISEITPEKKFKLKNFALESIKKQKSLGYALIGLFLLVFSAFSPFRLYYQIFATALILFSVAVFLIKFDTNR